MAHIPTTPAAAPPGREAPDNAHMLALLQATIEASTDALFVLDTQGRISIYNRQFVDLWNIPGHTIDMETPGMPPEMLARISDPKPFLPLPPSMRSIPIRMVLIPLASRMGE